tara:strand:- start:343 stop:1236 length:894 start_codon:yes stop_codon:yes gene_type:complete
MSTSRQNKLGITKQWRVATDMTDVNEASFFAIMIMNMRHGLGSVWNNVGIKYVMPAVIFLLTPITVGLAWREAALKKTRHSFASAVVETLTGAAFIVAGVASVASIAVLAAVTPILLTAAVAAKTLFSLGSAIYFGVKAAQTSDYRAKVEYNKKAKDAIVETVVGAVITAAAVTMMLVAAPVVQMAMAGLALAAALIAVIHGAVKSVTAKNRAAGEEAIADIEMDARRSTSSYSRLRSKGFGFDQESVVISDPVAGRKTESPSSKVREGVSYLDATYSGTPNSNNDTLELGTSPRHV